MHKLLYVDETGNNDVFIIGGLLIDYKTVEISYKRFKKSIQNIKLSPKQYIDNICSVYRKYICEDDTTFYDLVNNISEL